MADSAPLPSTFVATIDVGLAPKLLKDLTQADFEISTPPHTIFSAKKKGISCTLYKSGKLTVQGKEMKSFIEFYLEPEILKTFTYAYQNEILDPNIDLSARIGIDESGKGDFFGPLCIAGVYAEGDAIHRLKKLGVRDSKQLNDVAILKLAEKIRSEFVHHIVKINPLKYNELITKFKNLNRLLAWGHATAIEQLAEKTQCHNVIIDQFANEEVVLTAVLRKKLQLNITQRHRAEEDLVVAAASILARSAFLDGMKQLEKQFEQPLPKGASKQTIEAGKQFVRRHGLENLDKAAKMHFKTLDSIIGKSEE